MQHNSEEREESRISYFRGSSVSRIRIRERDRFRMAYLKLCAGMAEDRCKIRKIHPVVALGHVFRDRGLRLYTSDCNVQATEYVEYLQVFVGGAL